MDDQTPEPYDVEHLAATTPWSLRDWQDAQAWHRSRWEWVAPLLLAVGQNPRTTARALRLSLRDPVFAKGETVSPTAQRYAEALAAAAAAEARVEALVEQIAIHAYEREVAETQLGAVEWDDRMPKVWSIADGEPPMHIVALLDLSDGQAWCRPTYSSGEPVPDQWVKMDATLRGATRHEWPIDNAGPFIALSEAWALERMAREAARRDKMEDALHQYLNHRDGYRAEGAGYTRPPLDEAVPRVINALDDKRATALRQHMTVETELRALRRSIEQLATEEETTGNGITYEQLRALLPEEAPRG